MLPRPPAKPQLFTRRGRPGASSCGAGNHLRSVCCPRMESCDQNRSLKRANLRKPTITAKEEKRELGGAVGRRNLQSVKRARWAGPHPSLWQIKACQQDSFHLCFHWLSSLTRRWSLGWRSLRARSRALLSRLLGSLKLASSRCVVEDNYQHAALRQEPILRHTGLL